MLTASGLRFGRIATHLDLIGIYVGVLGASQFFVSRILNHKDRTVTGAYNMHNYFEEKGAALEAWGERLTDIVGADLV